MNNSAIETRIVIIKIIRDSISSSKPLASIYSKHLNNLKLSSVDRRFIVEVTKGTIKMSKRIDYEIAHYYKGKIKKLEQLYLIILQIAIYQFNYLDRIPDYAIVSTSVDITKLFFPKYSKLTNALLRNAAKRNFELKKPNHKSTNKDISIYYSHPEWIIDKWSQTYDYKSLKSLLEYNNKPPEIWFRYNKDRISITSIEDVLKSYNISVKNFKYLDNFFTIKHPSVLLSNKIFIDGNIAVQSPTNGLIVKLLDPLDNEKILDLCAAPGGKTLNISETMSDSGQIISYDINPDRINLLSSNLSVHRTENVKVLTADLSKDILENSSKMILDVPCSGTGTIAKNADLRWKKRIDDINRLTNLQEQILNNCSKYLNYNGVIVYSTCSIEEEENWGIIDRFLSNNSNYNIDHAEKYVDSRFVDSRGAININPYKHGIDGGFAVRLIKYDS